MFRLTIPLGSRLDSEMREIVRGATASLVLKVVGAVITFFFNLVLARLLGAQEAGLYFLAFTVATVAAVLGRVGLDGTILRHIASNAAVKDWPGVQGVYRKGMTITLAGSSAAMVTAALLAPVLANYLFGAPELTPLLRWIAPAIVPMAATVIVGRALLGLQRVRDANLVQDVGVPALSLAGVALLVPKWGMLGAVWAYSLATFATLLVGLWLWREATPHLRGLPGTTLARQLFESSLPLYGVACSQLVMTWTSTLMLGIWATSAQVGVFGIANRTATLTSFVLLAVNNIVAPKYAALHRTGDMATLGRVARQTARLMALVASPVLAICLLISGPVMSLFGADFLAGSAVLSILAIGQFVNVVTGSVGFLLIMCGFERLYRNTFVFCAAISIALNLLLIPGFGIIGAAIATAVTLALQNLIAAALVWRNLGVMTVPFLRPRSHLS